MKRAEILQTAEQHVTKDRQADHGAAEDNFATIGSLWTTYIRAKYPEMLQPDTHWLDGVDVAALMALLKIARLAVTPEHPDNWIDLAGYAACGGELATAKPEAKPDVPYAPQTYADTWRKTGDRWTERGGTPDGEPFTPQPGAVHRLLDRDPRPAESRGLRALLPDERRRLRQTVVGGTPRYAITDTLSEPGQDVLVFWVEQTGSPTGGIWIREVPPWEERVDPPQFAQSSPGGQGAR